MADTLRTVKVLEGKNYYKLVIQDCQFQVCISEINVSFTIHYLLFNTLISRNESCRFSSNISISLGKWPTWRKIYFYVFVSIYNSLPASSTSCSSFEIQIVSIQPLVTVTLCWWPCRVQVGSRLVYYSTSNLQTTRPPTQSDSYQRLYWYNLSLLMMSTMCSKHVESYK